MKILQLCCVSNLWPYEFEVDNIDLKNGDDVLLLPWDYGKNYDLICSAPPCDQFTKANNHNWEIYPFSFVNVALACLNISINSGKPWFMENPPGRIEKLIPALKQYRLMTWHGTRTNKEYVIYGNFLIMSNKVKRYGKPGTIYNYTKERRELWQPDFIADIARTVSCLPQL